jgi:hypothetical protein
MNNRIDGRDMMNNRIDGRDTLTYIFARCLDTRITLVCKWWTEIISGAVTRGQYAAAIIKVNDPSTLPAICFHHLTIEQKTRLPMCIRVRIECPDRRDIHLKSAYSITWREIMAHCQAGAGYEWLCKWPRSKYDPFAYKIKIVRGMLMIDNDYNRRCIHAELLLEYDQYREYIFDLMLPCRFFDSSRVLIEGWPMVSDIDERLSDTFELMFWEVDQCDIDEYLGYLNSVYYRRTIVITWPNTQLDMFFMR